MTYCSVAVDSQISLGNDNSQRILLSVLLLAIRRAEMDGLRRHRVAIVPAIQEPYESPICAGERGAALPVISQDPFLLRFLHSTTVIANDLYHNDTCKDPLRICVDAISNFQIA